MDNLKNEQTDAVLETQIQHEDEKEDAPVSFGKFKDAKALLSAYNSLQAEFTKRCQRIKELEGQILSTDKVIPMESEGSLTTERVEDTTPEYKEQVIREYLKDLLGKKSTAIVMDGAGAGVRTPVRRPKTVRAAGELAKELLGKN